MEKKIKALKIIGTIISIFAYLGLALFSYYIATFFYLIFGTEDSGAAVFGAILILAYSWIIGLVPVIFGIVCLIFSVKIKRLDYENMKMPKYLFISSLILIISPILLYGIAILIPNLINVAA